MENTIVKETEEAIYIELEEHPKSLIAGIVKETVSLASYIDHYKGPAIYLDFDKEGVLIGIEIC